MVRAISKKGEVRKLIYHQSLTMIDEFDKLEIDTGYSISNGHNLILKIEFVDEGKIFSMSGNFNIYTGIMDMKLHKWKSPYPITGDHMALVQHNDKRVWVRYQSTSPLDKNIRDFSVSIWLEE